jgi:hypothetical protein
MIFVPVFYTVLGMIILATYPNFITIAFYRFQVISNLLKLINSNSFKNYTEF